MSDEHLEERARAICNWYELEYEYSLDGNYFFISKHINKRITLSENQVRKMWLALKAITAMVQQNAPFITGVNENYDNEDPTAMPDHIHVCRIMGSDWVEIYKRYDLMPGVAPTKAY